MANGYQQGSRACVGPEGTSTAIGLSPARAVCERGCSEPQSEVVHPPQAVYPQA